MKTLLMTFTILVSLPIFSETPHTPHNKCESVAKVEAKRILQEEDMGSGLNHDTPVKFISLNNDGIYVVSGWIQKVFDWEVIVVLDRSCEVQSAHLNDL